MNKSATFAKRQRENQRREKAKDKELRKAERKKNAGTNPTAEGEDPDIAGIVPGPQPTEEET